MPYTRAQEKFFPKEEPGTPDDIALLEEIRDLLAGRSTGGPAGGSPRRRARPSRLDGRCATSQAVVGGHLRPQPRVVGRAVTSYVVVPVVGRRLRQHVAEDLGEPGAAARPVPGRLLLGSLRRSGHAQSPFCSASACASADGGLSPPPEPPPPLPGACAATIASLVNCGESGSSAASCDQSLSAGGVK